MYFIKDLVDQYQEVWIRCADKRLQKLFLWQAENEGFLTVNGQKPTELNCQELYGISADMTMGYLSGMIWSLTKNNPYDNHTRIDFGKYISGLDALIIIDNHQVWKMLFDEKGNLKYEGMTVKRNPSGSGTLYYPDGTIYKEGVFGDKGLLCGTEYYPNGNKRFSGLYKFNAGYGPNYPVYGACFHEDGSPWYEGEIKIRRSGLGWPIVEYPIDYGPVELKGTPNLQFFEDYIEIDDGSIE